MLSRIRVAAAAVAGAGCLSIGRIQHSATGTVR